MDYKYDVFISYSRKDTEVADKICQAFNNAGISYFIDRRGIGGGMEFPAVLAKAIKESKVFLFLASKNSYDSKFTQSEIVYAFNKKQKQDILPYIIDGSTLPDELEFTFSAINWRQMDRHPIDSVLIDDILSKVGRQRKPCVENCQSVNRGDAGNKHGTFMNSLPLAKRPFAGFSFSGKHLAWIVLAYSVVLFIVMLILSGNYLRAHYSIIEKVLMISIIVLFIPSVIGIVRPASMALDNRKDVLIFYVSSLVIAFFSLTSIVEYSPAYGENTQQTDAATTAVVQNEMSNSFFKDGLYYYEGDFIDKHQTPYPVEIQFMYSNGKISNCIYKNVTINGKLKMDGKISNDSLLLKGKAGVNDFSIVLGCKSTIQELGGYALDGEKRLDVSLKRVSTTKITGTDKYRIEI